MSSVDRKGAIATETTRLLMSDGDDLSSSDPASTTALEFDAALDKVGFGWGQYFVLLAAGIANASDSVEVAAVSFVITTTMECDLELDGGRKGWIISATFIGMMIGGWVWGHLSDKYGRKRTLLCALSLNASAGMGCALATNFYEFVMYRSICGIGIGGSIPILFSYYSEMLPSFARGKSITILAAFWMVGAIIVAALAYAIISPTECARQSSDGRPQVEICADQATEQCGVTKLFGGEFDSWRFFTFCTSIPAILAVLSILPLPESPRWLLVNGYPTAAEDVLRWLAKWNGNASAVESDLFSGVTLSPGTNRTAGESTTDPSDTTSIGSQSSRRSVDSASQMYRSGSAKSDTMNKSGGPTQGTGGTTATSSSSSFTATMKTLFSPPFRTNMILLCCVWFFLSFGFYGFTLWLPQYFKSGGIDDDADIYLVSLYVALSNLPGNAFAYFMVDNIGRKWTLIISLVLSGSSVFSVLFISSTSGVTAFSCVFAAVSVAAWNALDVIVVELFPTQNRSSAFGIQAGLGRLGSIFSSVVFGQFADSQPAVPMTVTGVVLLLSAVCCILLPNSGRGTVMH